MYFYVYNIYLGIYYLNVKVDKWDTTYVHITNLMMYYKIFTLMMYIIYINDKMHCSGQTWYDFSITILMTH